MPRLAANLSHCRDGLGRAARGWGIHPPPGAGAVAAQRHGSVRKPTGIAAYPALSERRAHGHTTDTRRTPALGASGDRAGRTAATAWRLRGRLVRGSLHPRGGQDSDPRHTACVIGSGSQSAISPACATFPRMRRASGRAPVQRRLCSLDPAAPPMHGGEYLSEETLQRIWERLDGWARRTVASDCTGGLGSFLGARGWGIAGRRSGRCAASRAETNRDRRVPGTVREKGAWPYD